MGYVWLETEASILDAATLVGLLESGAQELDAQKPSLGYLARAYPTIRPNESRTHEPPD
ncbi:MAG: hypothetical protein WD942_08200 [Dehalococcoidia bacterium]